VRGVRQQRFVRTHQSFNAAGCRVEPFRQKGHFVVAADLDAGGQIALPPLLHTALQGVQALGQAANQRVGAQRHGEADQHQHPDEAKGGGEPAFVRWAAGRAARAEWMIWPISPVPVHATRATHSFTQFLRRNLL